MSHLEAAGIAVLFIAIGASAAILVLGVLASASDRRGPLESFESISEWQTATFPGGTARGCLTHIGRELDEIAEAMEHGTRKALLIELADLFILWVGLVTRLGFSGAQVAAAIAEKMRTNRLRRWNVADKDGVIEHVREEA